MQHLKYRPLTICNFSTPDDQTSVSLHMYECDVTTIIAFMCSDIDVVNIKLYLQILSS